jgi:chromosome segregation ATPase
MALFKKDPDTEAVRGLSEQIARLEGTLKVKEEEVGLVDENNSLREEISKKKIELGEIEENHQKKIREVEHKVGLQQQKAEQDQKAAVENAKLEVEKANLANDKERFEGQMKFERDHLSKQIEGLERMVDRVMTLVPQHTVNENITRYPDGAPGAKALPEGDTPAE